MADRKYASDYQVEYRLDENGNGYFHRKYLGVYYRVSLTSEEVMILRRKLCCGATTVLLLLQPFLWGDSPLSRTWYTALPVGMAVVPAVLILAGTCKLKTGLLTRQQRDRSIGRVREAGIWLVFLVIAGCLGCWIHGVGTGQLSSGICLHLAVFPALFLLRQGKILSTALAAIPNKSANT